MGGIGFLAFFASLLTGTLLADGLLVNPGFDFPSGGDGSVPGWGRIPTPYRLAPREGMNGTQSLYFECAEGAEHPKLLQEIKVRPGHRYVHHAMIKIDGFKPHNERGATLGFFYYDKDGKLIGSYAHDGKRNAKLFGQWGKYGGITRPVPLGTVRACFGPFVYGGCTGKVWYDDIVVEELEEKPVDLLYSSAYRNLAAEGPVTFVATLNVLTNEHPLATLEATFAWRGADGTKRRCAAETLATDQARVTLDVADLAMGANLVGFELREKGGDKPLGRTALTFTRVKEEPDRPVAIDRYGRTLVRGRPYFPLGGFTGKITEAVAKEYAASPFNCVMSYDLTTPDELDLLQRHGLMNICCLADAYADGKRLKTVEDEEAVVRKRVAALKDHPGVLAWYVNDERPATMLRVGYKQRQNTLKITGASKVYTDAVNVNLNPTGVNGLLEVSGGGELVVLKGNFVDTSAAQASDLIEADTTNRVVVTGTGSRIVCPASIDGNNKLGTIIGNAYGRNSLEASDGGELYAPYRFAVGYSAMANNNTAVFKAGAKYYLSDFRIGENGSCGNHVEILSGANGRLATGYVGGRKTASHGNSLVIDSAELLCRQIIVSPMDGGYSNSLYIAGSDTSFTTTVTDLPNYPFVSRGRFNSFTLDGATWNYWLNMAIDDAAVSNEVRFVNGAQMLMGGGLFSGSDADASFGNRVTVSGGSLLKGTFVRISRKDNALVVSNAAVRAEKDGAGYIEIGSKLPNVDKANIADNALVLQGSAPKVSADKEIRFMNGSVFRIELPASGYGADHVPVVASEVSIDDTSRIEVLGVADVLSAWDGEPAVWTIVSAPGGITIPADVLAAANAQLSADSEGQLRLSVTDGGTRLVLKIGRRGLVLYLH